MAKRKAKPQPKATKPRPAPVWARKRIAELEDRHLKQVAEAAKTSKDLADFTLADFPGIRADVHEECQRLWDSIERLLKRVNDLRDKVDDLTPIKATNGRHAASNGGYSFWNTD